MIKFWYEVRPRQDPNISTLARLENGDPFLLEQKYGAGRLIEAVVPCDSDWSNLPTRPFYVPLMQRLTIYLASKVYPPRNVDVVFAGRQNVAPTRRGRLHADTQKAQRTFG